MRHAPNTEYNLGDREMKAILKRMTPMERWLIGRAGQWEFRQGRHYDPLLQMYVLRCSQCKHYHLAKQPHKLTCSEACKKARQRRIKPVIFADGAKQLVLVR